MRRSLYGPGGFFTAPGPGPAAHFRTSVHTGPVFAAAIAELVARVDAALGRPDPFDLIDVGGGRGELVTALQPLLPSRVRATVVEVAPRPPGLPASIGWASTPPAHVTGLVLATEWLDNVPVDVVELADVPRYVLVDQDGAQTLGPPLEAGDADWLDRWWPLTDPGTRAEIGAPRDAAWARAVATLDRGLALAVDYGHVRADRPPFGTLTGYRDGRQVAPVPDGSCDLTAHVAVDSLVHGQIVTQREALRRLGVHGARPPLELAHRDPAAYVRALSGAGLAAELTDPAGLGGHYWLLQPVGLSMQGFVLR